MTPWLLLLGIAASVLAFLAGYCRPCRALARRSIPSLESARCSSRTACNGSARGRAQLAQWFADFDRWVLQRRQQHAGLKAIEG